MANDEGSTRRSPPHDTHAPRRTGPSSASNAGSGAVARAASGSGAVVIVVDDDDSVLLSLDSLFRSVGLVTRLYRTPGELLQQQGLESAGCIVLDLRLPELSGLNLQNELVRRGIALPIVFMTGYGDVPTTVRAMKAGAVDFLCKPIRGQDMLDAVTAALERDRRRRAAAAAQAELRARYDSLTERERLIMDRVVAGQMNKQIAGLIGLSEITVKIHRGNLMRKMGAKSLADLVRKFEALNSVRTGEGNATG